MSRRSLRAAYAGLFLFGIAMALLGAILPALSQRLDLDLGRIGTLFLVMNLCILLSSLALGPLMDRFGTRPPLVVGPLLMGAGLGLLAASAAPRGLVAAVGLLGLGGGAVNSAGNTLVADLHDDARAKSAALNLLGVFFGFGALLLPFAIGLLLEAATLSGILGGAAVLCLAVALGNAFLPFPPPKQAGRMPLREAAAFLREPFLLVTGAMLFFQSGNEFIVGGYVSTFLTREMGIGVRGASWAIAGYWAALMLARVVLSRAARRVPGPPLVIGGALAAAAAMALLVSSARATTAVFAAVLTGAALAGIFPTALGMVGSRYPAFTGTVFGLLFTAALCGGVTLPWITGQIAQAQGLRAALALAAGQFVAVAALQWIAGRLRGPKDGGAQALG